MAKTPRRHASRATTAMTTTADVKPRVFWTKRHLGCQENVATVDAYEMGVMFDELEMIGIEESEFDGPSGAEPKHWHSYEVSANPSGHFSDKDWPLSLHQESGHLSRRTG